MITNNNSLADPEVGVMGVASTPILISQNNKIKAKTKGKKEKVVQIYISVFISVMCIHVYNVNKLEIFTSTPPPLTNFWICP